MEAICRRALRRPAAEEGPTKSMFAHTPRRARRGTQTRIDIHSHVFALRWDPPRPGVVVDAHPRERGLVPLKLQIRLDDGELVWERRSLLAPRD